jgi:hypothetical protein
MKANAKGRFAMPNYSAKFDAGFREKNLRWLEPYEGKLSRTVLRGGNIW